MSKSWIKTLRSFAILLLALLPNRGTAQTTLSDIVNPFISTKKILFMPYPPFVAPPSGMTHWTPQTLVSRIKMLNYHYGDKAILGCRAQTNSRLTMHHMPANSSFDSCRDVPLKLVLRSLQRRLWRWSDLRCLSLDHTHWKGHPTSTGWPFYIESLTFF